MSVLHAGYVSQSEVSVLHPGCVSQSEVSVLHAGCTWWKHTPVIINCERFQFSSIMKFSLNATGIH